MLAFKCAAMMVFKRLALRTHSPMMYAPCIRSMIHTPQKAIGQALNKLAVMLLAPRGMNLYLVPAEIQLRPKYVRKRSMRLLLVFVTQSLSTDQSI